MAKFTPKPRHNNPSNNYDNNYGNKNEPTGKKSKSGHSRYLYVLHTSKPYLPLCDFPNKMLQKQCLWC